METEYLQPTETVWEECNLPQDLEEIESPYLSTFKLDVRFEKDVQAFVSSIDCDVDILINNAGVSDGRWQSISEIDMKHAMEVIEVNSIAPVLITQKFEEKN